MSEPSLQSRWKWLALLIVVTTVAYYPSLHGGFILDDDFYLTRNPFVYAPDGLYRLWFTTDSTDYYPISNSSLWLEWQFWGTNPTGYHVFGLMLHLAASLLLWAILRKLAIPGAFLAALLFAVHPVNVESVAWISQRKNTLAMFFFLLSILWYLPITKQRTTDNGQRTNLAYWLSFLAFLLAMLSKGSVAVLPALLLFMIWWQRGRIQFSDLIRLAPFLVVSIALTVVNVWFQKHGFDVVVRDVTFQQRLAGAGAVIWFYLAKAILPIQLLFVYPQWQVEVGNLLWWLPLVAAAVVTLLSAPQFVSPTSNWRRTLLFAWSSFCVALVPVLGFTDVGFMLYSLVADHYQHLAVIAVVALAAAAWCYWHARATGLHQPLSNIVVVAAVGALTFATWHQAQLYRDPITLYQTVLAGNPNAWMIHNNLGHDLYAAGNLTDARQHFEQSLRLHPDYPDALNNLGIVLADQGHLTEAVQCYQRALQLRPDFSYAHHSLGNALSDLGRLTEAIEQYQLSLDARPYDPIAHYNLGNALLRLGNVQDAIDQYRQAIAIDRNFTEAYLNLADACARLHQSAEAVAAAQKALELAHSAGKVELTKKIEAWLAAHRVQPATP